MRKFKCRCPIPNDQNECTLTINNNDIEPEDCILIKENNDSNWEEIIRDD